MIVKLIDAIYEASVIPSYTTHGYRFRKKHLFQPLKDDLSELKVCITGSTSGLGKALAYSLARKNASLVLTGRSKEKLDNLRDQLSGLGTGVKDYLVADLSELDQINKLAASLNSTKYQLNALVNNAGYLATDYSTNSANIEKSFTVNCLAGLILMEKLKDKLASQAGSKVIHVSSGGMYTQKIDVENLQKGKQPFDGVIAYAQAKRAQVILNRLYAAEYQRSGIFSAVMHPGWAETPGVENSLPGFFNLFKGHLRTPEEGIDTILWLLEQKSLETGKLWFDRALKNEHVFFWTKESTQDCYILNDLCRKLALLS